LECIIYNDDYFLGEYMAFVERAVIDFAEARLLDDSK